jgi:hypothetical protein
MRSLKREKSNKKQKERRRWWRKWNRSWERTSANISSICWKRWNLDSRNRSQMLMSNSTIWRKSCERWQWMWTIWSIAFFCRTIEAILNRINFILRRCSFAILNQIRRICSIRNRSRCLCKICLLRTCRSQICLHRLWTMKQRVRFLINAFTAMKRIIYTREIALNSTRILKLKEFTCKKKEFISTFIISKLFTFEWFRIKISDNAWRTSRSWIIRIASSRSRQKFTLCVWKRTRIQSFRSTKKKRKRC